MTLRALTAEPDADESGGMRRALVALSGAAFLVLALEVAGGTHARLALGLAGLYAVIAALGFGLVTPRGRGLRAAYVVLQLALGFVVFGAAGAGVGVTILLLVLVVQAVLLLPIAWAAVVALLVPFVHLGMPLGEELQQMASTAVAVGFAFVLATLHLREQQARAELAEAHRQLLDHTDQAEALATQTERTRVAREIHDGLGHHLTVVGMQVRAARAVLAQDPSRAGTLLAGAEQQARAALGEVRRSVAALREPGEERPVGEALAGLASESTAAGLSATVEVHGTARPLGTEAAHVLYRATQEGLTNVRRHADDASAVRVLLDFGGSGVVQLRVEDDGSASTLPAVDGAAPGYGLVGIRERAERLGGSLRLGRSAAGGLAMTVELPG